MGLESETPSRISTIVYVARLVASIVVPVLLIGTGLWWLVSSDQVDRAVEQRADSIASLVDTTVAPAVTAAPGGGLATDTAALNATLDSILTPVIGDDLMVRIVGLDGGVLYSTEATDAGATLGIDLVDASVLRGIASGKVIDGDTMTVIYSVPLVVDGVLKAAVRIDVPDDAVIAGASDDAARLVYLFGGALIGVILALVPLCWWSLGEVRRQFRKTRVMAMNDALTGLANRTQFHQRLDEAIAGAGRSDGRVGLVMLDLDGFKAINDTGGHSAGDRLLKRVAAALGEATRRHEIACRLGGDEFAVLAPRISDRDELRGLADRLHAQLDLEVPFSDGRSLRVTASLGLSLYPDDAGNADELVNKADAGMYSVKASRKSKLPADAQARAAAGR